MRSLIFTFLFFSFGAVAQDSTQRNLSSGSLDIIYGQKFLQKSALSGAVNQLGNAEFGQAISYVGIGFTGILHVNRKYTYPASLYFHHIIPQKIIVFDSISGRVSGFNIHFPFAGLDVFRKRKSVDLILGTGINTGRIRLFGDARLEQVNAYFAPFVSISPRFVIGKIAINFQVEYELDITRSRWRKVWFSSSPKADLGSMRSTGLTASFSIGRTL